MTTRSTTMSLDEAVQMALDGRSSQVLCPAHEDKAPSLHVSPGHTQPVLLKCHAGCDSEDIIGAGGLDWATICDPLGGIEDNKALWTPAGTASHCYRYTDADGVLLYEVLRVPQADGTKRFMQRRPEPSKAHGHAWSLTKDNGLKVTPVLWKLPQVIEAVSAGMTIHVTEGEKCAEAVQKMLAPGEVATCNSGGAGKFLPEFADILSGANVVVHADADDPGRAHARQVRDYLLPVGATVKILEAPPGVLPSGKHVTDVADHIESGKGLDTLMETTPEEASKKARTGVDVLDLVLRPRGQVEYVIDNVMTKGERLILIGFEGSGKSQLCRQVAVQVAAGVHPFTGMAMEPRKVLMIDAENHPDQVQDSWSHLVGLAARHDRPVEPGMLTIMEEFETERDLTDQAGKAWLLERVHAYKPDLIIMGPLTNMASKDLREDDPVRKIKNAVNEARTICNSAFIMEHHAPLKSGNDRERPMRPYGSSMLLKWPDAGFGIKPTDDPKVFEWAKFRGSRVRSRQWPEALREGNGGLEWPWEATILQ